MPSLDSKITEPLIRELYGLWHAKCHGDLPPLKSDLPIQELPHAIWPHLVFYDVTDEGRYFGIYNGTQIVEHFGAETTGHYMDDFISVGFTASVLPLYDGAMERGRAVLYAGDLNADDDRFYVYSRLLLPLRSDGDGKGHIMGIMIVTGEEYTYNRPMSNERRHIIWDD